ncbi:MAG: hypothetical protein ACRD4M_00145 [Candidatus Acidiferrales bacterium]
MILAMAALLVQFQAVLPPALPAAHSLHQKDIQVASLVEPPSSSADDAGTGADALPMTASLRSSSAANLTASSPAPDTKSDSARPAIVPNFNSVRLAEAPLADATPDALKTVAFETTAQDTQGISTVHIAPVEPDRLHSVVVPERYPSRRAWIALSIVEHGAATFDAYSTRQAISHGAVEDDPMMRPFAHSPAMYAAMQVGPVMLDVLARHMQRSNNNFLRHIWWLPQSVSTAGFVISGVHNLNVASVQ